MFQRGFRRQPAADLVAALYGLVYFGWLLVRTPGTPASVAIGTVAFYPLGLAVAWANWRTSRVASLDRRTRLGWSLLAASALSLWTSGTAWTIYVVYADLDDWPWWVQHLELAQHVFAVAGYLVFPGRWPRREHRVRFIFDICLTVVAGFVLAFEFGARLTLEASQGLVWDSELLTWTVDWALFAVASVGFLQKRDATMRSVMGILLAANTAYLLGNFGLFELADYRSGDSVDAWWFAAWVLRWAAARFAWQQYRRAEGTPPVTSDKAAVPYRRGAFSYLMVAGAFMLLIGHVLWGDRRYLGLLAVSTLAMAALLLFRQLAELRENRRLFAWQLAQEARFRLLIQGSSDVVMVVDGGGTIAYVSPSAQRLYGEACAIRVGCRLADLVSPEDRAALDVFYGPGAGDSRPVQARIQADGNAKREVEIAWSDLRRDPVVKGIVLNCRDVTERNELERQLRHAQKLDEVGHLAGGLAHDFNNVLTAIRGYSELLRVDLGDPARAREDLAHVEDAVDRAAAVTRKLLALSRNQPVQRRVVDLNAVTRELLPLLRQLLTDRIEVSLSASPDLWPVKADQGQIEQVLLNLATNARDAMPNGGRLRILTGNRTVHAPPAHSPEVRPGEYAAIVVADEGLGMTPEVQARIFEPFFSTKPRDRGMGLGLAMVMGIVNDSGGAITVSSAEGQGSTFTVLLPRTAEAAPIGVARTTSPAPAASAARTVLLVDDEVSVRSIARRMLGRQGYRVVEAGGGKEAMELASMGGAPIDLLLTDLVMPGLHGTELIERFRAVRPGIPIVCMTGFAGDSEDALGLQESVCSIVSKPFSSEQLLRSVASALSR